MVKWWELGTGTGKDPSYLYFMPQYHAISCKNVCICSENSESMKEEYSVLSHKLGGGPMGLGDPDDRSLRKVEKNVLVPKLMRERTKTEKCVNEVKEFHDCCLKSGLLHVIKCRRENDKMKACMEKWYYNQDFIKECTEQYLDERSEFRRTGIPKKRRNTKIENSM